MRRWLAEDRPPTDEEQRLTLQLPGRYTIAAAWFWFGAALLFGSFNLAFDEATAEAGRVFTGIIFGGLATCGFTFLAVERVLRPVVVLALAGGTRLQTSRGLRIWDRIVHGVGARIRHPAPRHRHRAAVERLDHRTDAGQAGRLLALMGLVGGFVMTQRHSEGGGRSRSIASAPPWRRFETATWRFRSRWTTAAMSAWSRPASTRWSSPRGSERFSRISSVVTSVRTSPVRRSSKGSRSRARSVRRPRCSSTSSAPPRWRQRLPPAEVVEILNAFFGCVVLAVSEQDGWVNKFEGDGALCVFGAPVASARPCGPRVASRAPHAGTHHRRGGAASRSGSGHRRVVGHRRRRQRRSRRPIRVHRHRRPGERGEPAQRARQDHRLPRSRLRQNDRRRPGRSRSGGSRSARSSFAAASEPTELWEPASAEPEKATVVASAHRPVLP